jgi:hypothetical protein
MPKEKPHPHLCKNQNNKHLPSTQNHTTKNQNHQVKRKNKIPACQKAKNKQTTLLRTPKGSQ